MFQLVSNENVSSKEHEFITVFIFSESLETKATLKVDMWIYFEVETIYWDSCKSF